MGRAKTDPRAEQTEDRVSMPPQQSSSIAENDIARRAYDRYLMRGGEPGHALDDWLDAERELRQAADHIAIGRIQPTAPAPVPDAQHTTNTSETSKAHILRTSHAHRSRAHTASRGRRRQARRDST